MSNSLLVIGQPMTRAEFKFKQLKLMANQPPIVHEINGYLNKIIGPFQEKIEEITTVGSFKFFPRVCGISGALLGVLLGLEFQLSNLKLMAAKVENNYFLGEGIKIDNFYYHFLEHQLGDGRSVYISPTFGANLCASFFGEKYTILTFREDNPGLRPTKEFSNWYREMGLYKFYLALALTPAELQGFGCSLDQHPADDKWRKSVEKYWGKLAADQFFSGYHNVSVDRALEIVNNYTRN
ncbi:MAG: hypothetical protein FD145_630 [Candidatus Saganbacteria bacterium]|uniref:Uncharacterized protein n=1 Tax=Candidatus Saganbacteria bacterium TaxID=2575572 RepID=A0A833L1B9_UNCSA|nr:MAG: hypothetical protein FD145_630 [Candidatus Saganbacteria bacterium]